MESKIQTFLILVLCFVFCVLVWVWVLETKINKNYLFLETLSEPNGAGKRK
jgi:Na+/glutamate symporter